MARQSFSEIRTAFPRLPVIMIGSCVIDVSSISRYNFVLASVADNVGMVHLNGSPYKVRYHVRIVKLLFHQNVRTHLPPTLRNTEPWKTTCFDAGQSLSKTAELLSVR